MEDNKLLKYYKKKKFTIQKSLKLKNIIYNVDSILSDSELQITLETYRNTNGIQWNYIT